jgi:hypothetical protein
MMNKVQTRQSIGAAALSMATATAAAVGLFRSKRLQPRVVAEPTRWNQALLALCPHFTAEYDLPLILGNGHVETIFAALFRRKPHVLYDREILHMPDGGCVAIDTEDLPPEQVTPRPLPLTRGSRRRPLLRQV